MSEENTDATPPTGDDTIPSGDGGGEASKQEPVKDDQSSAPSAPSWSDLVSGMAAKDEKLAKQLEKFSNLDDFAKSYSDAQKRISEGFKPPQLPKDATEDQVKEYRQKIGVPDNIEDYQVPEGIAVKDEDKPLWDLFLGKANELNLTQSEFEKVAPAYYAMEQALAEQAEKDAKETYRANEAALKEVWGTDMQANLNINENFLVKAGGDELKERLAVLGNDPIVAKFLNDQARLSGFTDGMVYDSEGSQQSIQDEIDTLMKKRVGENRENYYRDKKQVAKDDTRLNELYALRERYKK